jgi:hypothetical protein
MPLALPKTAFTDELRLRADTLAIGDTLALVAEPIRQREQVLVHLYMRDDESLPWEPLKILDSHWLPEIGKCLREAAVAATPSPGRKPGR